MKRLILVALLTFISMSANAGGIPASIAPITTTSSATDSDNRAYAGLKWTLNSKISSPEIVIGIRHTRTESNGDTQGGDVSFSFGLLQGITAGKFRTKYFNGNETIQAEIGGGYDFTDGLFTGASINLPYATMGSDYLLSSDADSNWQPNFILHTQTKHKKPSPRTSLSCPPGLVLNPSTSLCDDGTR